jgi:LuxR family maltose regulon positive regulatory protein
LHVPQLHEELITRSILIEQIDQMLDFPLTLISAPAGYGKTTLLVQWIAGRSDKIKNRVAWVSLEGEGGLRRFWTYILTALEEIQPGIGKSTLTLLESSQPPIYTVIRLLINEFSAVEDDFVLILDDYHHVDDPAIHATLVFFVDHLPPNLHLAITSRNQPPLALARWRASNQLIELREADLRFTPEEVTAFFNETKGLNLSMEDIAALESRTEGWIAGLHLVALSLRAADETAKRNFVSEFTGSQRFILDYLVEEVLQQQPESIKTFLLQTSVLDHLSESLCNAVTGKMDGQAILERLERAHIFTIPLDHKQRWYRYHHLFKDILQHRLQQTEPGAVFELHRRAAEWYIQVGRTDDAIRHACAAQEWDQAVELIEPIISTAWNRGEIRKIISWLGKLPVEHLDTHPHLSLYYSRALLLGGEMEAAEQRLRESEKVLRARLADSSNGENRLHLGTICAFRTTIAAVTGETAVAQTSGREALSLLPPDNIDIRAHAMNSMGVNHYYLGEAVQAAQMCAEASKLGQEVGNYYLMMAAASYQAKAFVCQGQIKRASQVLEQALSLADSSTRPTQSRIPAASVACANFGNLLYEWNRLEEAERYLSEAIELGRQLAFGSALWHAYHTLARIKLVQGDQKAAESLIEQAKRYRLSYTVPLPTRLMDAELARAQMALGHLKAADRWARTYRMDQPVSPGFVHEYEGVTRARLYFLQDQPKQALALLDRLHPIAESGNRNGHLIELLVLTALTQHALDDAQQAINTLHTALRIAEPEGYLRIFVDEGKAMAVLLYQAISLGNMTNYKARLLATFPTDEPIHNSSLSSSVSSLSKPAEVHLIDPLSEREIEVLQLIANGATNHDIAEELVIAMTTAKKHVSNIIQKLGVDNRTQAAVKGRNLGLCE